MMDKIRVRFTEWYVDKGYTFTVKDQRPIYGCPWWVKPFTWLLSPSLYYVRRFGKVMADAFYGAIAGVLERYEANE